LSYETSVTEPSSDSTPEQSIPLEPEQSIPSEEMVDSDKKMPTGNSFDKLKCSYKKCNNRLGTKEQLSCAVLSCKKKIHASCFHHYIGQSSFNFDVRPEFFYCATKACCAKFWVGNQGPTTRWDSDGPNGANTVPNRKVGCLFSILT
jgi:hypothetical protein